MNERIKELAVKAKFMAEEDINRQISYNTELKAFAEKFAELIVEEMYDFMCKATDNDGAWPSSKEVKQHFGVDGMSTEDKKTLIKELLGVKE
jgi:hypothetical protein